MLNLLNELKRVEDERLDLDEVLLLKGTALLLRGQYEAIVEEIPQWLNVRITGLTREINVRRADRVEKELREARLEYERLATPAEKRERLQKRIEQLEKTAQGA